ISPQLWNQFAAGQTVHSFLTKAYLHLTYLQADGIFMVNMNLFRWTIWKKQSKPLLVLVNYLLKNIVNLTKRKARNVHDETTMDGNQFCYRICFCTCCLRFC